MTPRLFLVAGLACAALATASLLVADEPVYDAWAWLVWGRELAQLELDLSLGPSFKPLPVLLTTPLAAAGAAAPEIWLAFVRTAWLFSIVLAAELAYALSDGARRGARIAAAAFAAIAFVCLLDAVTAWGRQAAGGMTEPLLAALVLAAVRADLARRPALALALGGLGALVRPEIWPLLGAYALWCARALPRTRPLAAAIVVLVPLLWLGPDLLSQGDALTGAQRAQRDGGGPLVALGRAALLPLSVAWPLALLAAVRGDTRLRVLGAGALAWIALVVVMAAGGFAGLARFMAPAAAIVGVLGGVGLAQLLELPGRRAAAVALALAVFAAAQVAVRADDVVDPWRTSARIAALHERLYVLVGDIGRDELLRCGRLSTSDVLVRTGVAYELGVPLQKVVSFGKPSRRSGAFLVGIQARPDVRPLLDREATLLGARREWRVYSIDCPASAGVTGARR